MVESRRKIPGHKSGFRCATPTDETMIQLLGGQAYDGVTFTNDQIRSLYSSYGHTYYDKDEVEKDLVTQWEKNCANLREKHAEAVKKRMWVTKLELPKRPDAEAVQSHINWMMAGSQVNMFKHVKCDGLRAMAYLAKFLEKGEDPVKLIANMAIDAGFDAEVWEDEDEGL
jgi:hypothetical protein